MKKQTNQSFTGLELCIAAANADPSTTGAQLEAHLRRLWTVMSPAQRLLFMADPTMPETLAVRGEDSFDKWEAEFERLVEECNEAVSAKPASATPFIERVICEFPGFVADALGFETDGAELVDFVQREVKAQFQSHEE